MGPFVQEHELNRYHFLPPFSIAKDSCLLSLPEAQPSVKTMTVYTWVPKFPKQRSNTSFYGIFRPLKIVQKTIFWIKRDDNRKAGEKNYLKRKRVGGTFSSSC
jgi:hypothetical protein